MRITALVEALVAAGASPEMILAAVRTTESANEAALEQAREKTRVRVEKWRAKKSGNVTDDFVTVGNGSRVGDVRGEDKPLPQKIEPQESKKEQSAEARIPPGFDEIWALYPNKVGKADAVKAFVKALGRADLETITAGLRRYAAKTDDRPWCNPSTWLNQDRWTDQPATVLPMARGSPGGGKVPVAAAFGKFANFAEIENARRSGDFGSAQPAIPHLSRVSNG